MLDYIHPSGCFKILRSVLSNSVAQNRTQSTEFSWCFQVLSPRGETVLPWAAKMDPRQRHGSSSDLFA